MVATPPTFLVLPESNPGIRDALEKKKLEYKNRAAAATIDIKRVSALLKLRLTDLLLRRGSLEKESLREEVERELDFSAERFENAWGVLTDYIRTGGDEITGGTGITIDYSYPKPKRAENPDDSTQIVKIMPFEADKALL